MKKHSKHSLSKFVIVLICSVLLITVALLLLALWDRQQGQFPAQKTQSTEKIIVHEGESYQFDDKLQTVLVLGLDKFNGVLDETAYTNNMQADFMMLLIIDDDAKTCTAIHINRDTMTQMNVLGVAGEKLNTVEKQIALAHTYGNGKEISCRNTADAVSNLLLGVKINHYVSLTMDSVGVINDLVGGVTVTVNDDFSGIDDSLAMGETITLNSEQALHFVRTRYGLEDSTNQTRMSRQRQYLRALMDQATVCAQEDENFAFEAVLRISDYLVSDCTANQLQTLFDKVTQYQFDEIVSIEGESLLGDQYMEFYPNEDALIGMVAEYLCKPAD